MDAFAPPVFMLGAPRSFTSLVCAMLGQHPEAYGVPELNLMVVETLDEIKQRYVDIRYFQLHGLLRTVAQLYGGEQTLNSVEMAHRWLSSHVEWSTQEVYHALCAKVYPLRIIDKSPVYATEVEIMRRIYRTFPNAHFLHLVRHPLDMGKSLLNIESGRKMAIQQQSLDYSTNPPTIDPQFMWYKMQSAILEFLQEVPSAQQMCVRGEYLLANPEEYFQKICNWLGFSWDEKACEAVFHPETSLYACFGPFGANLGNDPNFLKSPLYRPSRTLKLSKLEGQLPWRPDGKPFLPQVMELAQRLGYD
jgi:hypothetical protein